MIQVCCVQAHLLPCGPVPARPRLVLVCSLEGGGPWHKAPARVSAGHNLCREDVLRKGDLPPKQLLILLLGKIKRIL